MDAAQLIQIKTIFHERAALALRRGREILERFPAAARVEVESHQRIPQLFGDAGNVEDWNRIKSETLVVGVKKGMTFYPNGRSADFIAPSTANGCAMSCAYCYVPRSKGYANPITVFANIDDVARAVVRHAGKLGPKTEPNTVDPSLWVYDIGCNSDCAVDALISDNVRDLVARFRHVPNAKASFATKFVNRALLDYDPRQKTRVRFSLLPARLSKLLDVRTSPIEERIAAIDDFVAAGYEVHLNFSPVVITDGWLDQYAELFAQIDGAISARSKAQLAAEVIFLTHNEGLHQINLGWHPKAEELLWRPDLQEQKVSERGGVNLRYRAGFKGRQVQAFCALLREKMPYCPVRYAF